jgi:Flp pilus assembly protein, protease CpaA
MVSPEKVAKANQHPHRHGAARCKPRGFLIAGTQTVETLISYMPAQPLLLMFPLAIVLAGFMDLISFTIPNRIPLFLAGAFVIAAAFLDMPGKIFLIHLAVGVLMLLLGVLMFACRLLGGGDAKLMAAAALWLGFDHLLPFLFWTAALGGLLALALLTYRRFLPPIWLLGQSWAMRLHDSREGIPYGIAIAGAGLVVYPNTIWMTGIAG